MPTADGPSAASLPWDGHFKVFKSVLRSENRMAITRGKAQCQLESKVVRVGRARTKESREAGEELGRLLVSRRSLLMLQVRFRHCCCFVYLKNGRMM